MTDKLWRCAAAAVILILSWIWHWSGLLTGVLVAITLIDPEERWKEFLEAIKRRDAFGGGTNGSTFGS